MDSELMHSIVGSYIKPPERMFVPSFTQKESSQNQQPVDIEVTSPKMLHSPNSQALILALKTLQEKIHRLELERTQAEDNLNILSREAAEYKKALENETNERNLAHEELIKQKKDISIQLSSAQSRCTLLEKQLEYTKRMVLNVEREKNMILEQQAQLQREKEQDQMKLHAKLEKLDVLEKECFKLTTTQKTAEAQLQREKEQDQMKLHAKLEKLDVLEKECFKLTTTQKTAEDKIKYLEEKLKEEEHQRKLFQDKASEMMEQCSPHVLQKPEAAEPRCLYKPMQTTSQCKAVSPAPELSTSICDNLSELLIAMQDEMDQMSMEHQELLKQMKETESHSVCDDIECELERLVKKMEIKAEQISKLRKHQDSVRKLQQKVQNSKMSETSGIQREDNNPKGSKNIKNIPRKCLNETNPLQKNSNFHPIRVHNLQVKLRRDDIMEKEQMQTMDEMYKFTSTERIQLLEKELAVRLTELKSEVEDQGSLQATARGAYSSVQIPKDISYFRRERELALKKTLQVAEPKPLAVQADVMQRELESCLRREYTPENLPLLLLQKQVGYIMQEYNDAVQRAERLSVARENFLMGKNNAPNLVTQEDLTIYTKWLVCHLHSLRTVHRYLQSLQYLPISNVLSVAVNQVSGAGQENEEICVSAISPDVQGSASPGPTDTHIPATSALSMLNMLNMHINSLGKNLALNLFVHNNANSMLGNIVDSSSFAMVSQKFQSIFMEQQRMQTFPDYEAENLGMTGPAMTLKKRANWISFIKIKPKCDPWQKKLLTKLKDQKRIDTLMQFQAKFLKALHQCNYDHIWENIYGNLNLYQDEHMNDDLSVEQNENAPVQINLNQRPDGPPKQKKETGYNYAVTLQLLGLDDGTEFRDRNPVLMKGAYLSFLSLRHLRIRELQVHSVQFMEFSEVENQDDYYSTAAGFVHTQDQQGVHIMYDEALSDLKEREAELLLVASHYIEKEKGHKEDSESKPGQVRGWAHPGVDRFAVLFDVWTWEAALLENKRQLLDSYFEAYQHTLDPEERFALGQVMTDIMHRTPRFDLDHPYFIKAYQDECTCLRIHLQLVRGILNQHAALIPKALEHLLREARHACRPATASGLALLERKVLQLALDLWLTPTKPEAWYSAQLQKDLFSAKVMGDPFLVEELGVLALKSAADEGQKQGRDTRLLLLETFSKLLELLTLRHRLIEMSLESAHLARLYKELAWEMGFEEFHLYLRPVHFEFVSHKDKVDPPPPIFMTSLLEDKDWVDRLYKELAWEMGFEEFHLYLRPVHFEFVSHKDKVDPPPPIFMTSLLEDKDWVDRAPEAFVSIQLEKVGLRDMMLNAFLLRKQSMADSMKSPAAFRALKLTLQLVASLHDIVAYLFSFAKLGNCPAQFDFPLSPNPSRSDWGGAQSIGSELRELQKMIDSLQNPQDPIQVAQALLLRREVMFLQFDAAMRHLIRRTFLAAGNVPAYQSVTDGMHHGLPPLSNSLTKSIFASQLSLPPPLDPRSLQAFALFPWRAFLEDGGLFPVISSSPDTLEYNMQLCLCGLSDRDRERAHGELVGMRLLMEDVILSSCHVIVDSPPGQQATPDKNTQLDWFKVPRFGSQFQSSWKASELLEGPHDTVLSLALLRSFFTLWKQLEVLKEHWGRLKLQGQDINSVSLYKQFSELYEADILYPSLKAIARQMGKEDEFEEHVINSQSILPPKGASEIEIKTQQLQKLLENIEMHMIQEVLRKVNREMTLLLSEKSREDCTLPTDLWKHHVIKEDFSVVRPHIVEKFRQGLMENYKEGELEITFRKDHLNACLASLGCDVMARERSNFETYSMCYEHVLQHARQRLCQKEQELDAIQRGRSSPEDKAGQVAELSHGMIMEVTALKARLADLEEENLNLKKQIRKEVQEEYEELVQALFATCLHIKEKLDENQLNLIQKVCELISEVKTEGTDNIKDLKKKWGSARPDEGMKENPAKEQLRALEQDNCSLAALVCKARSLGRWRLAVQQTRLQSQLSRAEKELIQSKKECLSMKLTAEQEVGLFRQEILALRQALARAQADNVRMWKQQQEQAQLLKELQHRVTQDAADRQQLDFLKTSSMEKLLEDVRQKEQQLQLLTEEAERSSQLGQLQQRKMKRELHQGVKTTGPLYTAPRLSHSPRTPGLAHSKQPQLLQPAAAPSVHLQLFTPKANVTCLTSESTIDLVYLVHPMRSRLAQERSVKLNAFQRVEELQSQLTDSERWSGQMSSSGGKETPPLSD
ncbi:Coiled-coil domain-containing protein 162 [Tupaia chinensis]|uniref:Centrosomal protein CEP57L1 n=1 Tax=Tupaia chinensis TaxID=246437 RepID=L9JLP7_TUPCH|nr:Coiled-coil domain-containing protein 162 [Tupaia chinensis]